MFTKRHLAYTTALAVISLNTSACTTLDPGVEVRTVEVVREVQKPCPGIRPPRPSGLGPLAPGTENALAQVLAKLAEYSAPGKYADQAEAYFDACPTAE